MRIAKEICYFAWALLVSCETPSERTGSACTSDGPESLKPASFSSIHVGMTRTQVERILGKPDHTPIDGQDYFGTPGECEVEPGYMGQCIFVIEYRDDSKPRRRDTGRVTGCYWGGVGE